MGLSWVPDAMGQFSINKQSVPPLLLLLVCVSLCSSWLTWLISSTWCSPTTLNFQCCHWITTWEWNYLSSHTHRLSLPTPGGTPAMLEIFDHAGLLGMTIIYIRWRPSTTSSYDIHTKETELVWILYLSKTPNPKLHHCSKSPLWPSTAHRKLNWNLGNMLSKENHVIK